MKKLERTLKALANKRRLAILKYLKKNGESSVGELAKGIKLSFTATSKHLAQLRATDILDTRQAGLVVFYRINKDAPVPTKSTLSMF